MKIEIGESLLRSWLRHVEHCQFAELNWKPSPKWNQQDLVAAQDLMDRAAHHFEKTLGYEIFKKTKTVDQLIRQAESDALGLKLSLSGSIERVYCAEVAFHEGGLLYKTPTETAARFIKKMMRSLIVVRSVFGQVPLTLTFLSPHVTPGVHGPLSEALAKLREFGMRVDPHAQFQLWVNSDFHAHVLRPVLECADEVADTSELFLRSYQMLNLFADTQHKKGTLAEDASADSASLDIELEPSNEQVFKTALLQSRRAEITVYYRDGRTERRPWDAGNFQESSDLMRNLRSRQEFRRQARVRDGIVKIKVKAAA